MIEPLRMANSLSGKSLFRWQLASLDGHSVVSASDMSLAVSGNVFADEAAFIACPRSAVLVCAGEGVERFSTSELRSFLRRIHRAAVPIYALGTATWLLAEAKLLDGAHCTIHWGKMAALYETFYGLAIDDALFVRDGSIVTCAGELAAFDLAMDLVRQHCDVELARSICQHLAADRWRDGASAQSLLPGLRFGSAGKKLSRILQLMERNIEEPLSLQEIAQQISLSRRQVERLFERHLSTTPRQHYLTLKLRRARQLVEMTEMSVTDIAMACGFESASYFSKSFKEHFDILPSVLRAR
ncbi:GlxA family transcriptional regulator [Aminobacter anthyllidis]|uniref:GlxA family transcriptional regulator n=1 Tax=Aminobacter anthyllidis TaxID=1035067 RepID=UPI001BDCDA9C|nr:GlxA family transcriptional regulator [Aminobacter anthyllidis]